MDEGARWAGPDDLPEGFWEGEGAGRRFWPACDYPSTQKGRVEANGIRFWVEQEGQGPPLVLLHGGPGIDHRVFHPELSRLARFRRLIYYDMRGHSMSSEPEDPEDYGLDQDVQDLEALRRAFGFDRLDLLGYSYGGAVALKYAAQFAEHVDRVVICSTMIGLTLEEARRRARAHPLARAIDRAQTPEERRELFWRFYFYKPLRPEVRRYQELTQQAYDSLKNRRLLAGHREEKFRRAWDPLVREPPRIERPILFAFGRHDPLVSIERAERWIEGAGFPAASLVVFEESRHTPFVDEPEAFTRRIRAFLEG